MVMMEETNGTEWKNNYVRVLGQDLQDFIGQNVILLGEVLNVQPNGTSMTVKTTDNVSVTVQLPPDTMDEPQGIVELRGIAANDSALSCVDMIKFHSDPRDFDGESYTESVRLIRAGGTAWTRY